MSFDVRVCEKGGESRHRVTMRRDAWERLRGRAGAAPEEVIRAAFRFLLDREPKESILARFDVSVISRYFPDFRERLASYLA